MDFNYLVKRSFPHAPYFQSPRRIPAARLQAILRRLDPEKLSQASVYHRRASVDKTIRNAKVMDLGSAGPVHEAMKRFALSLNRRHWKFPGRLASSRLRLAEYSKGGLFDWHSDGGGLDNEEIKDRVLTVIVFLSEPGEYGGGRLEIRDWTDKIIRPKQRRGDMICFSGCQNHRVTPVTKGRRYSLVLWLSQPAAARRRGG